MMDRFKALYEKIKKVKHIHIYIAIGLALLIAIIYFSSLLNKEDSSSTNDDKIIEEYSSSLEYVQYLENKLESVLTTVNGAGDVEVAIT